MYKILFPLNLRLVEAIKKLYENLAYPFHILECTK